MAGGAVKISRSPWPWERCRPFACAKGDFKRVFKGGGEKDANKIE